MKVTDSSQNVSEKFKLLLRGFSLFLALAVLGLAVHSRESLLRTLKLIDPWWTIGGLLLYIITYGLRALRFFSLSKRRLKIWPQGLFCTFWHGLATYLLPMRSGDLTLPFILQSKSRLTLDEGFFILYKARLLDVFALGAWIAAASLDFRRILPVWLRTAMFGIGVLMLAAPLLLSRLLLKVSPRSGRIQGFAYRLGQVGALRLVEVAESIGIWSALGACIFCIARAMGLSLDGGGVILLIGIQMPLQFLPVQGVANTGNHEGGWIAGLTLLGYSASAALNWALTSHLIFLLYVLAIGPITLATGYFSRESGGGTKANAAR